MFEHPDFDHYEFADVPMNRDTFLLDAKDMAACERDWMKVFGGGPYDPTVLVSYVGVRLRAEVSLELSWYPNVNTRFHEVKVSLPKTAFVRCVGCRRRDGKPSIFVHSDWLRELYLRAYSIFASSMR